MASTRHRGQERGFATVELALVSVWVVLAAGFGLWLVTQLMVVDRCEIVAHQVARQAARGDAAGVRRAIDQAPKGAHVQVASRDGATSVTVRYEIAWQGLRFAVTESSATVLDEARP